MIYRKVQAPIDVMMSFREGHPEPMVFKWGNRHYHVKRVNLVHTERHGREKVYIFSVSDDVNAYRLSFSSETMNWMLEDMAVL